MPEKKVVIVGAGPSGLSCARVLAEMGQTVTIIERKRNIGVKVCAGGITWNGLLQRIPAEVLQKTFRKQILYTPSQQTQLHAKEPMLATVNRYEFGQYMLKGLKELGVEIINPATVTRITKASIQYRNQKTQKESEKSYTTLIGADGHSSIVRKYLGITSEEYGVGINYQIPISNITLQWHLKPKLFKSGYGWVFPHKNSCSIGAYVDHRVMTANTLKENLIQWADEEFAVDLAKHKPTAEKILFDYQGYQFGNVFLVGEAAGLTSALTGEGINAAILSANYIAEHILANNKNKILLESLIKKQQNHLRLAKITRNSNVLQRVLPELLLLALKCKIIDYSKFELTH